MLNDQEVTRLMDIALAGCHKGAVGQARRVLAAIEADRPDYVPAKIGKAFSHTVVNEFEEADAILKAVLESNAGDADAQAYLGLNAYLAGRKDEARAILEPLADNSASAGAMARSLLEQI